MYNNRYLIIACCVIVIVVLSLRQNRIDNKVEPDQKIEPAAYSARDVIDRNILLSDQEIAIKKSISPNYNPKKKSPIPVKSYISAEAYLVGNLETGEIYNKYNISKVYPIASVSKLYTSLVVHHLFDQDKTITITQSMLDAYGEAGHLVLDEKMKASELLYALLLESSNDAAEAFAQSFGYKEFMTQMNGFALEIGMNSTSFKDASGLSPGNVSNVQNLFTLAKYLYREEHDLLDISKTREMDFATTTEHGFHHFVNINPYVNYPEFIGGKTGRTEEAKEAMISLFKQDIKTNYGTTTYPVAVIILRSEFGEREIDTEKLLGIFIEEMRKK